MAKAQNSPKQPKRKATRGSWAKGKSGNPGGRPANGITFAAELRHVLSMTGPEIAKVCRIFAKDFKALPEDMDMRKMIILRWIASVMSEPTPGLLQQMIDRTDGPVPTKISGDEDAPLTIKVVYVKRNGNSSGIAGASPVTGEGKE